jgi:hypothetical protein
MQPPPPELTVVDTPGTMENGITDAPVATVVTLEEISEKRASRRIEAKANLLPLTDYPSVRRPLSASIRVQSALRGFFARRVYLRMRQEKNRRDHLTETLSEASVNLAMTLLELGMIWQSVCDIAVERVAGRTHDVTDELELGCETVPECTDAVEVMSTADDQPSKVATPRSRISRRRSSTSTASSTSKKEGSVKSRNSPAAQAHGVSQYRRASVATEGKHQLQQNSGGRRRSFGMVLAASMYRRASAVHALEEEDLAGTMAEKGSRSFPLRRMSGGNGSGGDDNGDGSWKDVDSQKNSHGSGSGGDDRASSNGGNNNNSGGGNSNNNNAPSSGGGGAGGAGGGSPGSGGGDDDKNNDSDDKGSDDNSNKKKKKKPPQRAPRRGSSSNEDDEGSDGNEEHGAVNVPDDSLASSDNHTNTSTSREGINDSKFDHERSHLDQSQQGSVQDQQQQRHQEHHTHTSPPLDERERMKSHRKEEDYRRRFQLQREAAQKEYLRVRREEEARRRAQIGTGKVERVKGEFENSRTYAQWQQMQEQRRLEAVEQGKVERVKGEIENSLEQLQRRRREQAASRAAARRYAREVRAVGGVSSTHASPREGMGMDPDAGVAVGGGALSPAGSPRDDLSEGGSGYLYSSQKPMTAPMSLSPWKTARLPKRFAAALVNPDGSARKPAMSRRWPNGRIRISALLEEPRLVDKKRKEEEEVVERLKVSESMEVMEFIATSRWVSYYMCENNFLWCI